MAVKKREKKIVPPMQSPQKLKEDLANGTVGNAYIFCGPESYLRAYYLKRIHQTLIPAGFEEFNAHRLDGANLTVNALTAAVEAMPMLAERTLTVVTDWDLFRLKEDQRNALIDLLNDLPPYCCLIFVYDTLAYEPNGTMKKLCTALANHVVGIEFLAASSERLVGWIARRFQEMGKEIDRKAAEHLIFLCGDLMTGLAQEIQKIGSYVSGTRVTTDDIDAIADPVLDAVIFDMTNAITAGDYSRAAEMLDRLLKQQEEPVRLLDAIGRELRRLYSARLAIENKRSKSWLMEIWGMRDYPARLLLNAARRITKDWCVKRIRFCQELDRRMKSQSGIDAAGELKLLLVYLGAKDV